MKTKLKIQSGRNDWQLHEETNLVNGPEAANTEARRRNKGGFTEIAAELSENKDSISELLRFFRKLLEYETCLNLQLD